MYPADLFALYPPFPREDKVFVAMSFDPRFNARWSNVIAPAIRAIQRNETPLEPIRVDTRVVSDSILTEILSGVGTSRFVVADITTVGYLDNRAIRNANVMYEVGLAHAVRLPEEILLFRSDADELLFDTSHIRVNSYDPDKSPEAAKKQVGDAIISAAKEIDLKRQLTVRRAAESFDQYSWVVLTDAMMKNGIRHPPMKTMGDAMGFIPLDAAISRLLALGALKVRYVALTLQGLQGGGLDQPIMEYVCTEFGQAILSYATEQVLIQSPELKDFLEQHPGGLPPVTLQAGTGQSGSGQSGGGQAFQ